MDRIIKPRDRQTHPPYRFAAYKSTGLRGPAQPLVPILRTLSEITGPVYGHASVRVAIFGHSSTDLAEVLRAYEQQGLTRTINCCNEVEMAHTATGSLPCGHGRPTGVNSNKHTKSRRSYGPKHKGR